MDAWQSEKFAQLCVPLAAASIPFRIQATRLPAATHPNRLFEQARISHEPEKGEHTEPRRTYGIGTVQLLIEPVVRSHSRAHR
jgi:hypothetical protein